MSPANSSAAAADGDAVAAVAALRTEGLEFSYGSHPALKRVAVEVHGGQFAALIGPNGAGKTTLFSIVTGLYAAHRGSVAVMGHDLRANTLEALACMGVVFQRTTLDLDLSVEQNLHYAAALQGIARAEARRRIAESLQRHGLSGLGGRRAASLSGGQRRRVELARALLHEPRLLLLDEPTVGLDLQSRAEFVAHVKGLCRERRTGVLWATHLLDEVDSGDYVYILDRGEIVARGEHDALLQERAVGSIGELFNRLVAKPAE